ncbi:HAD-IIIA family hydrolase [Dechloromonas sp. XY25]|uniref:D,D-heptose 1,7-bisphosphate phosphatase n=1 Tax=Dechloromonas hankyongensis TaxID=2908002 RepID=A0ABS9K6N7_9RHOO|nr:HAD-IIIA family hydrolase [Dechloromonas hankyongensis]MCG2578735.1 HAD-IIIA family hydrolase [Dechloromonas hankyongensis]
MNAAVFLDKDGTLVHDRPYSADPARLRLRAGAGAALARLQAAGYRLILASNQPGLALGRFSAADLAAVEAELARRLARHGVRLDAAYYCPHRPAAAGEDPPCACRKPQPGLLQRAAAEHGIDLRRSWMVGDILDDVEAGHAAGCRSVLLDVGSETVWRAGAGRRPDVVARDFAAVATAILRPAANAAWLPAQGGREATVSGKETA